MSPDVKQREPNDLTRINVDDELEVHWWSVRFSVTPDELRSAVDEHGPSAEAVQKKLHAAARESFKKGGED